MAEVSRKVLATRYRLLPYLYSAHFDSHTYGCPVARPLFFGWPAGMPLIRPSIMFRTWPPVLREEVFLLGAVADVLPSGGGGADNNTRAVSEQWMMGDALLVSPILYQGATSARAYFPQGTWCACLLVGSAVRGGGSSCSRWRLL